MSTLWLWLVPVLIACWWAGAAWCLWWTFHAYRPRPPGALDEED